MGQNIKGGGSSTTCWIVWSCPHPGTFWSRQIIPKIRVCVPTFSSKTCIQWWASSSSSSWKKLFPPFLSLTVGFYNKKRQNHATGFFSLSFQGRFPFLLRLSLVCPVFSDGYLVRAWICVGGWSATQADSDPRISNTKPEAVRMERVVYAHHFYSTSR